MTELLADVDLSTMPRGGPNASKWNRSMDPTELEFLDREDVSEKRKRAVMRGVDRLNRLGRIYPRNTEQVMTAVSDVYAPRILELGAGHGQLARQILTDHPDAVVTASDYSPDLVATMAASDLGSHPRATVKLLDATAIDAPDQSYDLAVFTSSMHHLTPDQVVELFREATRVARSLLVIDLKRESTWRLFTFPVLAYLVLPLVGYSTVHDGIISARRAYGEEALETIAAHAGCRIWLRKFAGQNAITVIRRPIAAEALRSA
ncbi:class I SAM-dependent methyltransferase [Nocardia sp. NPDC051832]|uniref:class I SAM-dependent methyltransferase n=1 Tax=Nocardia sp. NPDC051832 TaxID=3155673 RepID=UPI003448370C